MAQRRFQFHLPLFWRILLVVMVAGLLPLLLVTYNIQQSLTEANQDATNTATQGLDDKSLEAARVQAKQTAQAVSTILENSYEDTLGAALLPRNPDAYRSFLSGYQSYISYPVGTPGNITEQRDLIPLYPEIAYVDETGHEKIHIVSGQTVPDSQLRDVSIPANTTYKTETYFAEARALPQGQVYVSHVLAWHTSLPSQPAGPDPVLNGVDGSNFGKYQAVVRFATPLFTPQGTFDGVVVLTLDARHIIDRVIHTSPTVDMTPVLWPDYKNGNYAYVWDDQGYLLVHPLLRRLRGLGADGNLLPTWPSTKISDADKNNLMYRMGIGDAPQPQMYEDVLQGKSDVKIYTSLVGVAKVNVYAPIFFSRGPYVKTGIFGGLTIGANLADYHRAATAIRSGLANQQNDLQNRVYGIILAAVALLFVFVIIVSRSVTTPVRRLMRATRYVEEGHMDTTTLQPLLARRIQDEISQLARVFQGMAATVRLRESELEESQAQLEQYNTNLEHLVGRRTVELEKANQEITALNTKLEADNMRMSAELSITRRLQQMILPKDAELNSIPGLDVAGFMEPAEEVGGDYYDVLREGGRVKIGIGDVTGHGLESGVMMIMVQTAVRTLLNTAERDPAVFLNVINRTIFDNVSRMRSDKNLSLSLIDYSDGKLSLSGQHEEMIVVRADGTVEVMDTVNLGFPIGLEEDISRFVAQIDVQLAPGDVVVLYTDGVTEAENAAHILYGLERLCAAVKANHTRSAIEIKLAIIEDVKAYIGGSKVYDDITLLVLKQQAAPLPSAIA